METMSSSLAWALLILYYLTLGILALYGTHRFLLVLQFLRSRRSTPPTPDPPEEWPLVTVQLPLYNEMYVARRLIDAVCRLDYPRHRLEIQVLDDSTDETRDIVAERVEHYRGKGFAIHQLHRVDRTGFKAGALAAGLARAEGSLLAVFDADFVPSPDFLKTAIPHFADPDLGMVQARWGHINRDYSLLTRIQAILLDGHFVVEHTARHRRGCFFNFNGTAGIWRREAIEAAGGWQHDTLTEDLDLSYRAQLAGWRFLYLPDLVVASELPVDVNGFKSQQYRWARGSIQTGRKLLRDILSADLPRRVKLEAFVHLTNNVSYLLMVLLALLVFPAMWLRRELAPETLLIVDLPLFAAATLSVLLFYVVSQVALGGSWRRELLRLPALMGLGIGLSINNARAVLAGFERQVGIFERTPKYRIESRDQEWQRKRYRVARDLSLATEFAFVFYLGMCLVLAIDQEMWLSLPFLYLFFHGYSYIALMNLAPRWRRRGRQALAESLQVTGGTERPAMEG